MKISLARAKPLFSLAALILVFGSFAARGQTGEPFSQNTSPLAAPTSPVMDYAGVVDPGVRSALEKRVIDFKNSTGVELGVAVVRTTGERPIFDYSLAVARGWGIGSKEDDNPSALLFIAVDDRKYFTQVSRDLEDELPDGVVGNLQRQHLVPEFRKGDYGKGVTDTVEAYIRTIEAKRSGTATPTPTPAARRRGTGAAAAGTPLFCCLAIVLVIILIVISNRGGGGGGRSRRDHDRWGGGFGSALPWIIGSAIANSSSGSSSSSGWGSSSGWSGGSDWGGFGGGGDFGGGGAGGDW